jgi:hypothetical protein
LEPIFSANSSKALPCSAKFCLTRNPCSLSFGNVASYLCFASSFSISRSGSADSTLASFVRPTQTFNISSLRFDWAYLGCSACWYDAISCSKFAF